MSFQDSIATVNPKVIDDRRDQPARIYWRHGAKQQKAPGFFYVKASELTDEPGAPWKPVDLYDEAGFMATKLRLIPIAMRATPFISRREGGREIQKIWLPKWEKGAQIYNELLCLQVEGLSDAPVVWVSKGLTGAAVSKALKQYHQTLLRAGEKIAGRRLPAYTFWLTVRTEVNEQRHIVYRDTGFGSQVTLPQLEMPAAIDQAVIDQAFVGEDLLVFGEAIREQFDSWLKSRPGDDGQQATNGNGNGNGAQTATAMQDIAARGHATIDDASAKDLGIFDTEAEIPWSE